MKTKRQPIAPILNVFLLSLILLTSQTALLAEPLGGQPSPESDSKATVEETLAQLNRAFDALEAAYKDIPRDTFDPEAALELAGLDANDVFRWVRDNTYFVPYRGALRGPVGVLMDRTGNSLDRALLLNEFLRLLGYQTRLARAGLVEAQAENLLDKVRPIPPQGAMPPSQANEDPRKEVERYAKEFGLDQDQLIAQLDKTMQDGERLRELADERVAEQTAFLLEKIGLPRESAIEELRRQQISKLQDHWWVQYQDGANWVSLDPTLPDAEPGRSLAEPSETRVVSSLSNIDESLLHSVRIKVVLECWHDGGLHEETLLESPPLRPTEILGQPVTLQHIPVNWPADLNLFAAENPQEALKTTALKQDAWAPALRIGSKTVLDRSYTSECNIDDASKALSAAGKLGGAVGGRLGKFRGDLGSVDESAPRAAPEKGADGRVTAQWIDYEVAVPGEPSRTIRRRIFDLVGSAARKASLRAPPMVAAEQDLTWRLALLGQTDVLLLGNQPSWQFSEDLFASSLAANRQTLMKLIESMGNGERAVVPQVPGDLTVKPIQDLYAFAVARLDADAKGGATYLDRVNLITHHRMLEDGDNGVLVRVDGYDVVANEVAVQTSKEADAFPLRLNQGVRDTISEALLSQANCDALGHGMSCRGVKSTSELYGASKSQGIHWIVVADADGLNAPDTIGVDLPSESLALIRQDLASGYAVVMPTRAIAFDNDKHVAWWRVDTRTGDTLGMIDNGWGGTFAEYTIHTISLVLSGLLCVVDFCTLNPMGMAMCVASSLYGLVAYAKLGAIVAAKLVGASKNVVLLIEASRLPSASKVGVTVVGFFLNYGIGSSLGPGFRECRLGK